MGTDRGRRNCEVGREGEVSSLDRLQKAKAFNETRNPKLEAQNWNVYSRYLPAFPA
jgi:hypothetical protein